MKRILFIALTLGSFLLRAAVPPPAELFPQDTLALVSVPDFTTARSQFRDGAVGRLWSDPSIKPFRDKLESGFKKEILGDLEKQLGVKTEDYLALLQGQISIAVVENGWNAADDKTTPALIVVLDTKDKAPELKARLAEVRQKLSDAKRPVKIEKIRDIEFSTVTVVPKSPKDGEKSGKSDKEDEEDADGKTDEKKSTGKTEFWTFGQVDSVLVVSDSVAALEKVVARLTGGSIPPLGELPEFQGSARTTGFDGAMGFGWINSGSFVQQLKKMASKAGAAGNPMGIEPAKLMNAVGLDGFKTLSFAASMTPEGELSRMSIAIPEGQRAGLFKMLEFSAKDSSPPSFVPADSVSFRRTRLDTKRAWETLEATIQQISPQLAGMMQLYLGTIGKDKDAGFDFHKAFVANLGDDIITYQKSPKGSTLEDLQNAPSITLVSSSDAVQLVSGILAAGSLLPNGGGNSKERDFNGHRIHSLTMPGNSLANSGKDTDDSKVIEVSAGNGYLALSTDPAILEQFLRSGEGDGKSLRNNPGLMAAADKVGGLGTGFFGYQDAREGTRIWWEALRQGGGLEKLGLEGDNSMNGKKVSDWLDFSVLPPFETISKFLGLSVFSGKWEVTGFHLQGYWPSPK